MTRGRAITWTIAGAVGIVIGLSAAGAVFTEWLLREELTAEIGDGP